MRNAIYLWAKKPVDNRSAFLDLCRSYDVVYVFMSAYRTLKNISKFSSIIEGNELDFYAMASTNTYALNTDAPIKYIEDILRFNDSVRSDQRFAGVHFDVEPYALQDYRANEGQILTGYVEMLKRCHKKTRDHGLEFGVSIPYWYDYGDKAVAVCLDGRTEPCSHHIIDNTDHVSVMAYRPRPDLIASSVEAELDYSTKKVFVAVNDIPQIGVIKSALEEHPALEGIAIHHYHTLADHNSP